MFKLTYFAFTVTHMFIRISLIVLAIFICACEESSQDTTGDTKDFSEITDIEGLIEVNDQSPMINDEFIPDQSLDLASNWVPDDMMNPTIDQGIEALDQTLMTSDLFIDPNLEVILEFITPVDSSHYGIGEPIDVQAQVTVNGTSLSYVAFELNFNNTRSLPFILDRENQTITASFDAPQQAGTYILTLSANIYPSYRVEVHREIIVACDVVNTFDTALNDQRWQSFGPTIRDEGGWLELTQNQVNTRGGIFWTGETVQAGSLDIEFSFSTSKCAMPGVCNLDRINAGGGFAMNFWNIPTQQVEQYWEVMRGLGNTTPQQFLVAESLTRPESFHVVFDTYSNSCDRCGMNAPYNGCGNAHYEPSHLNHVSIITDGHNAIHGEPDETGSYCHLGIPDNTWNEYWADFPEMDNGEWHHAHITIEGTQVTVRINEQELINFQLPNFSFKGGVLSFSAGSGVNGNFHRIDQLRVNQLCQQ